jgi:hypothetical protein
MATMKPGKGRGRKKKEQRKAILIPKAEASSLVKEAKGDLPLYCDFSCPNAEFPPADAVGACRREQAVWCGMVKRYGVKNGKCLMSIK